MQADEGASDLGSTRLFSDGVCVVFGSEIGACEDSYGNLSVFEDIIPKYLKVVKTCKGEACTQEVKMSRFLCDENNKCKNEIDNYYSHIYYLLPYLYNRIIGFYTPDGMIFYIFPDNMWNGSYGEKTVGIIVDVNGNKGPNILNVDVFAFAIDKNGKPGPNIENYFGSIKHLMSNGWKMDY